MLFWNRWNQESAGRVYFNISREKPAHTPDTPHVQPLSCKLEWTNQKHFYCFFFLLKPIRDNLAPGFPSALDLSPVHAQKSSGSRLFEHQKFTFPEAFESVIRPTGKLCWQKWCDVKITTVTQNSHFSKFHYIHLPSCITSIPITLFTLVSQLSKSVEKNLAYYGLLNFWNKHFMPL